MHVDMGFVENWPCTQVMATRRGQFGQLCWLHSATYDITIPGNDVVGHIIITAWVSKVCNAARISISRWFDPTKVPQASCRKGSCGHQGRFFFLVVKIWLEIMTDWNWENDRMCVFVFPFVWVGNDISCIFFFRMVFVVYLFPNMILHNSYKRLQVYASFWNTICEHEAICENLKKAQAARKPRPSHRLYWFCKSLKLISAKKQNIYNTVL